MAPDADSQTLDLLDKQLGRYQAIVSRLAGNSVQVKTWCFTATAGLAALGIDRGHSELFGVALGLVATFFYLDAYYLALEQHFRVASTELADRVGRGDVVDRRELLVIASPNGTMRWPAVLRCGARSQTAVIYLIVTVALLVGLAVPA